VPQTLSHNHQTLLLCVPNSPTIIHFPCTSHSCITPPSATLNLLSQTPPCLFTPTKCKRKLQILPTKTPNHHTPPLYSASHTSCTSTASQEATFLTSMLLLRHADAVHLPGMQITNPDLTTTTSLPPHHAHIMPTTVHTQHQSPCTHDVSYRAYTTSDTNTKTRTLVPKLSSKRTSHTATMHSKHTSHYSPPS